MFVNLNILSNCIEEARLICGSIEDVIWNYRFYKTAAFYTFSGGYVIDILNNGGIFDNVKIYDFVSQYPSVIIANNISYETVFELKKTEYLQKTSGYITLLLKNKFSHEKPALVKIEEFLRINAINYDSKYFELKENALKNYANFMYGMYAFVGK
ncbi:DNA polymerase-like protein, partial [Dinothrombium tinctorium]